MNWGWGIAMGGGMMFLSVVVALMLMGAVIWVLLHIWIVQQQLAS